VNRLAALALAIVLAACSAIGPGTALPTPSRALGPGERWLPVANWADDHGTPILCAGGGFVGGFFLRGSPEDPRMAWMRFPDGTRHELAWPIGYSARFDPALEVLDDRGHVIAREGSHIGGGCETADPDVWSVGFETGSPD
jgi:hypothetical protein